MRQPIDNFENSFTMHKTLEEIDAGVVRSLQIKCDHTLLSVS